jgi:hypothetical protein
MPSHLCETCLLSMKSIYPSVRTMPPDSESCFKRSGSGTFTRILLFAVPSSVLPSCDEQDPLERTLVLLLDDLDHATDPAKNAEVVQSMRAAVRSALA